MRVDFARWLRGVRDPAECVGDRDADPHTQAFLFIGRYKRALDSAWLRYHRVYT